MSRKDAYLLSCVCVPEARRRIVTSRQHIVAIAGKDGIRDFSGMTCELTDFATTLGIPQARGLIIAACQKIASIWRKVDTPNRCGMSSQDSLGIIERRSTNERSITLW